MPCLLCFAEYLPLHGKLDKVAQVLKENVSNMDSHAAATLRYIRASMDGAALLALPGSAGIALGLVGLLATALSYIGSLRAYWVEIWLLAGMLATVIGSLLVVRESSLRGLNLVGMPLRRFALCLFPSLFIGLIMTALLWRHGDLHDIPGTWLIAYGGALIAASATTTRTIGVMGAAFSLLGLITLLLPDSLHIPALAAGFGGLHIVFGIIIGRRFRDRQV
jgi:hypothetical protein